ncbi:MAG: FAD-dependent oxidoreductase [Novosphingobium sp.]|nr:FAD-dependent oxidoreductase [Novosphingobium sp.]MCP5388357.1 FAD-dependent oxidoreductase [Novosphingobium sp.]
MGKPTKTDVLIVGAGHAGAALACALRRKGFAGSIILSNDEAHLPYERPPLSKACLLGVPSIDKLLLREQDFWKRANIDILTGCRVAAIDPGRNVAKLGNGRSIQFSWCVLATGGRARALDCPGADLSGIYRLRTFDDMLALHDALSSAERLTVIGGGYIGLEVAATARALGKQVDVVETQSRVLSRSTSRVVSTFLENEHRRHGVRLHMERSIAAIEGEDRALTVQLSDGTCLFTDLVLAGIGIDAETALAEAAGIACHAGVLVDSAFRSSAPNVLAIGDCARHPNDFAGGLWRLESVQHAEDSANIAADTILGRTVSYHDVPAFWSDQYDFRLQSAGIAREADDMVVRGDTERGPFSVVYLREGRIIAIDAVNAPREFIAGRRLIAEGASVDRDRLADSGVPLRALA